MVNLNVDLKHFKKILGCSMTVGSGHFSRVLYNKEDDILIKVSKHVYRNFCPDYGDYTYDNRKCLRENSHFVDEDQIEYFSRIQSNVSLTKLPYGIVKCDGINAGILLPYHVGYTNMGRILFNNSSLLKYLEMLFERIRELELNKIVQTDLACNFFSNTDNNGRGDFNIVINNNDMQLIDLDGAFVNYNNLNDIHCMYLEFIKILDIYNYLNNVGYVFNQEMFFDKNMNYEKARNIFEKYKMMI